MKKLLIGFTLLGATLSASAQVANVVLDNCVLKQNPHTRVVSVSYELTGDTPVYVTLDITTNNVSIPVPERVWGDITTIRNPTVIEPDDHAPKKIYWDAKYDWPSNLTTEARATVTAWYTNDTPLNLIFVSKPLYVVVDLSKGPTADSYPVRTTYADPSSSPLCKTTELWLRHIPAGTFWMGSPSTEDGRNAAREDLHQVTLTKDFYIGVFPVTQRQWLQVKGAPNPSGFQGDTRPVENLGFSGIRGSGASGSDYDWPNKGYAVSATSFMGLLRLKTGLVFDLPTDAQWEYACRAGTTTPLYSGKVMTDPDNCPNVAEIGRYYHNQSDGKGGYSANHTEVGSYLPNAWGLYDMHGNIGERVLDWHINSLTNGLPAGTVRVDPKGPGSSGSGNRVGRGASFNNFAGINATYARSASRPSAIPETLYTYYGFRVCILPAEVLTTP